MSDALQILLMALVATLAWFFAGGLLYMNPFIAKIYKSYSKHPSMKQFSKQSEYFFWMLLVGGFVPILISAVVYDYLSPIGFAAFGLILFGVRIIPRACDMWMQTSYPNKLLLIELINGFILSFAIVFVFSVL